MLWSNNTFEGSDVHVAVWHIIEDEETLLAQLAEAQCAEAFAVVQKGLPAFHNPGRRREWLAVRLLVATCLGGDKTVSYDPDGRPFLTDRSCEISISHTKDYAALAWHLFRPVGVDVERKSDRVMRVVRKYVNAGEQTALESSRYCSPDGELLLWTAKEALYKAVGIRSLDCLEELSVDVPMNPVPSVGAMPEVWDLTSARCSANHAGYNVWFCFTNDIVLSLCIEQL